ncbi:hypothetical protein ACFL6M_05635 [Candidatus Eisenbacteria bacterium]|uniref:T9SS type A sorting domain-containing protein n=1 Tax=Eiseniibacteriota bacterium TaxID=2212470 RepID=A0ABV6YL51_UNCEI
MPIASIEGRWMVWDATGVTSGIYFYLIETPGFRETRKMTLLK